MKEVLSMKGTKKKTDPESIKRKRLRLITVFSTVVILMILFP
jgi:hypothetical protein